MPLGYRSIFSVHGDQGATSVAAEQFRSWLGYKKLDADATEPGLNDLGDHARLVVTHLRPQDGSHALRYRLTESTLAGEWVTTLTARQQGHEPGWIWVDVNAPPYIRPDDSPFTGHDSADDADPLWTGVPRLVRHILGVTDARDGDLVLADRPTLVRLDELDDLIDALCDPERRGAAIVAAPIPDVPSSLVIDHAEELTRQCVGLAGMYVLDDEAAEKLQRSFGPLHAVPYGALRTYLPGVDPASAVDARRHRIMLARTIVSQPTGKLARTLGWATRIRAVNLPLPAHMVRVDRLLSREEPAAVLRSIQVGTDAAAPLEAVEPLPSDSATASEAAAASVVQEATEIAVEAAMAAEAAEREVARTAHAADSAPVEEAAASAILDVTLASEPLASIVREFASEIAADASALDAAALVAHLRDLLAEGRLALRGHAELSRQVTAMQAVLEEVEDERDEVRTRLEDEQLDHAETQTELLRIRSEADHFRAALAAANAPDDVWANQPETPQTPGSFEELLAWLEEGTLPGVTFTGDPQHTLELDFLDPLGTWAAKTWQMLRAADGYVQARKAGEFSNGLHAYLCETPPGRPGYSAGAHAAQESESVEQTPRFRKLRELSVPEEVSADKRAFMGAHFKIARQGLISPRMHYLDDTAHTGKVYVGYIGRHLPNTLTN